MTTPRLSLTTGGALLTALLLLTGYASAQSLTPTLTLLCEGLADPNGIVIGSGGVIYGTTYAGGSWGQAYSLTPLNVEVDLIGKYVEKLMVPR